MYSSTLIQCDYIKVTQGLSSRWIILVPDASLLFMNNRTQLKSNSCTSNGWIHDGDVSLSLFCS